MINSCLITLSVLIALCIIIYVTFAIEYKIKKKRLDTLNDKLKKAANTVVAGQRYIYKHDNPFAEYEMTIKDIRIKGDTIYILAFTDNFNKSITMPLLDLIVEYYPINNTLKQKFAFEEVTAAYNRLL